MSGLPHTLSLNTTSPPICFIFYNVFFRFFGPKYPVGHKWDFCPDHSVHRSSGNSLQAPPGQRTHRYGGFLPLPRGWRRRPQPHSLGPVQLCRVNLPLCRVIIGLPGSQVQEKQVKGQQVIQIQY